MGLRERGGAGSLGDRDVSGKRCARTWLKGHLRDPFVREANARGYRSRAAFKLRQIDDAEGLLGRGRAVVDLGAAPGGWAQVAAQRCGGAPVVAVDLLPMDPLPGVRFRQGDFSDPALQAWVRENLPEAGADLVLSDMAPNLSGVKETDQARSEALAQAVLAFAGSVLAPRGAVLLKVFQGSGLEAVRAAARADFRTVKLVKPPASRSRSAELYLLARRPMVYSEPA